jgi:non-specific serine/threonine protein kinase/serine/threonine-protein kinase
VRGESVTTASDVYALGVVLYELLAGQRPYRVAESSPADMVRIVCDTEPQKPSSAVRGETADSTRPASFAKALSGDLDTIVLKALRKEPSRRYASVGDGPGYPAAPPGPPRVRAPRLVGYRAGKFARRHRVGMAAASIVLVSLMAGLFWNLREARRARAAEARAERRFAEVRKEANSNLFELNDAIKRLPGSTPARALLVRRALEYLDGLAKEKGTDAALRRELAEAYQKVGDVQAGSTEAGNLGQTAEALKSYGKAVVLREALAAEAPADPERRQELATTYSTKGRVLAMTGDVSGSLSDFRKALRLREELLGRTRRMRSFARPSAMSYSPRRFTRIEATTWPRSGSIARTWRSSKT